jgi:hypothetical protein
MERENTPCAICLLPVEDARVEVLFKHSTQRQSGEAEWKLAWVHEACFVPLMHPEYAL